MYFTNSFDNYIFRLKNYLDLCATRLGFTLESESNKLIVHRMCFDTMSLTVRSNLDFEALVKIRYSKP